MGPSINLDPGRTLHRPPRAHSNSNTTTTKGRQFSSCPSPSLPRPRVYIKRVRPIVAIPSPRAYVPSAAAPAALRKPDNSVPRDGGRGEVERRRRRRVINLGCSCVCGTSEAETCPAGHCAGQSPLVSSCRLLFVVQACITLITVVCDLTSHVQPTPPFPSQRNRILSHFTAQFPLSRYPCARPSETLSAAGAPSQSPVTSNGFLEAHPNPTFGLRHALPYHVCCGLTFMRSPGHRPASSLGNPPSKLQWELTCSRCSFGDFSRETNTTLQNPPQPNHSLPPPSPCLEYTVSTPLPQMCCYWPIWPRLDQEIDGSAGCQRSDLWATQNAWTSGPGVWFAVDLQWPFSQKRIHFFSGLQTIVSERPCSPVEPSCR